MQKIDNSIESDVGDGDAVGSNLLPRLQSVGCLEGSDGGT